MVFRKKGLPEEGDTVICTVKKVLHHSVFVSLDEYVNLEGMIHISEIAPGRIRNMRDYVSEGRMIVCKVLLINEMRGSIDLSLRRVPFQQKLKKEEEFKQEIKAEKLLEFVAQKSKTTLQDVYAKAGEKMISEYGSLTSCFMDIVARGDIVMKELEVPEPYAKEIADVVRERIKPIKVSIAGEFTLESFAEDGIEKVKAALKKGEEVARSGKYDVRLTYASAPKYLYEITSTDYKSAEAATDKVVSAILVEMKALGGTGEFKRKE